MSYTDWTEAGSAGTESGLDDSELTEGNASLYVRQFDEVAHTAHVLTTSLTASPTEYQVNTLYKAGPHGNANGTLIPMGFFRYQDPDNWYNVYTSSTGSSDGWIGLGKMVNGSFTEVDSINFSSINYPSEYVMSNGLSLGDEVWFPFRLSFWVDASNDVRARIEEDADEDDTYTQIESDLVDSSPSLTGGGGIGIGWSAFGPYATDGPCWFDQTEVYY